MDFARSLMEARGYGEYERMDVGLLPNVYVAYRTSLSEGTEVFHSTLRERWLRGDAEVLDAMETWAGYAAEGRACLLQRNYGRLSQLVDANFDLRAKIYHIDPGNLEMVRMARTVGATANFAGSGGAIVGTFDDEAMFGKLATAGRAIGVAVIKPKIVS
jgi:glucuronokinase